MEGKQGGGAPIMTGAFTVTINDSIYQIIRVSERQVSVDGSLHEYDFISLNGGSFSLVLDGKPFIVNQLPEQAPGELNSRESRDLGRTVGVSIGGISYVSSIDDEQSLRIRSLFTKTPATAGMQIIKSPMPGLISRIEVHIGEEVAPGKGLLVLEAMKMENEIRSTKHGCVKQIHVVTGKVVEKDQPLITISEL